MALILLWLLGVPGVIILLLFLLGVGHLACGVRSLRFVRRPGGIAGPHLIGVAVLIHHEGMKGTTENEVRLLVLAEGGTRIGPRMPLRASSTCQSTTCAICGSRAAAARRGPDHEEPARRRPDGGSLRFD